jgi:lipopolysaccharide biosynthesis glycosyltransferase
MVDNSDVIHAALAICDPNGTYARHTAVTLESMFENTKAKIHVYLLHDDTLTVANKENIGKLAQKFGQAIDFINVDDILNDTSIDVSKLTMEGFRGSVFRLLLPDLIKINKLIYLDSDLIINLDINELWNIDIENFSIGAVRDVRATEVYNGEKLSWRPAMAYSAMNVNYTKYFNAGVLLMNLDKIRKDYDFLAEVEHFYMRFKKCITLADQDCLNGIFNNDVDIIDRKFNTMNTHEYGDNNRNRIWHLVMSKPWTECATGSVDELYWHYLANTPYCNDTDDLINIMVECLSKSPYVHRHSSDCIRRLGKQLRENVCSAHIWLAFHVLTAKIRSSLNCNK